MTVLWVTESKGLYWSSDWAVRSIVGRIRRCSQAYNTVDSDSLFKVLVLRKL